MDMQPLASLERYDRHRRATLDWLARSIAHGRGGSCAHFSLAAGWSAPYPETTGYLIPTLIAESERYPEMRLMDAARALGYWLLSIQLEDGTWSGGLYTGSSGRPGSVFNTAQVLLGLAALHDADPDSAWLASGVRAAEALVAKLGHDGLWPGGDYRSRSTPTYYAHATWPLLEIAARAGRSDLRTAAERAARALARRQRPDGSFAGWAFDDGPRATTHTIAYTLHGLLACARRLDDWPGFAPAVRPALERLARRAELANGRIPGAFGTDWSVQSTSVCLTGSAQLAGALLLWEAFEPDLRIVNAAAKLVDWVARRQALEHPLAGVRGAVAGSAPVWGDYMRLRFPNWAAKFHVDALSALSLRLEAACGELACASS